MKSWKMMTTEIDAKIQFQVSEFCFSYFSDYHPGFVYTWFLYCFQNVAGDS